MFWNPFFPYIYVWLTTEGRRRQQQAGERISVEVAFPRKTEINPYARINYSAVCTAQFDIAHSSRDQRWREEKGCSWGWQKCKFNFLVRRRDRKTLSSRALTVPPRRGYRRSRRRRVKTAIIAGATATVWPTSSSLTFSAPLFLSHSLLQSKQMYSPWFVSGAARGHVET